MLGSKHVRPRQYDVTEQFTMGGVEVRAVWCFTIDAEGDIDVRVYVSPEAPTPEAAISSGARADIDIEDVPANIVDALEERISDDRMALREATEDWQ